MKRFDAVRNAYSPGCTRAPSQRELPVTALLIPTSRPSIRSWRRSFANTRCCFIGHRQGRPHCLQPQPATLIATRKKLSNRSRFSELPAYPRRSPQPQSCKLVEHKKPGLRRSRFSTCCTSKHPRGVQFDEPLEKVTILQLLRQHTGGWDRDRKHGFDPMFASPQICTELKIESLADGTPSSVMLVKPLDFEPTRNITTEFRLLLARPPFEK